MAMVMAMHLYSAISIYKCLNKNQNTLSEQCSGLVNQAPYVLSRPVRTGPLRLNHARISFFKHCHTKQDRPILC